MRSTFSAADDLLRGAEGRPQRQAYAPPPGKFIFRPRTSRVNWRLLHSLDLDRVIREGDVDMIQAHMENIAFARFSREDLEVTSDDCIIKVVTLAQLCMEFLMATCTESQHLIQGLTERVRIQAAQLKVASATSRRSERPRRSTPERSTLPQGLVRKCPHCPKRFQSEQYLNDHMLRRHIASVFEPPPVAPWQVEKPPESEMSPRGPDSSEITEAHDQGAWSWSHCFPISRPQAISVPKLLLTLFASLVILGDRCVLPTPWVARQSAAFWQSYIPMAIDWRKLTTSILMVHQIFGHDVEVRRHAQVTIDASGEASLMVPWPIQRSGVLCQSMPFVYVISREACQSFALKLHHQFYAHRSDLQPERCITFDDCSSPVNGKSSNWKLYAKPASSPKNQKMKNVDTIDNGICVDTWLPEWTEDAEVACQRWANDSSWGALRKGRRLKEACGSFWAQLNCAKTCGCPLDSEGTQDDLEEMTGTSVTKVVTVVEACK
eukprot:symbB.v1.2.036176.t1/scaffold5046.1/size31495/3